MKTAVSGLIGGSKISKAAGSPLAKKIEKMNDHQKIDAWSFAMMKEIVARIDADPNRDGLRQARETLHRWHEAEANRATDEWLVLLE